jgi:hypothetical protein
LAAAYDPRIAKTVDHPTFRTAVERAFQFLVDVGFSIVTFDDRGAGSAIEYRSDKLSVTVWLADRYCELDTAVRPRSDEPLSGASLSCLYVRAGLGAANEIKHAARSGHSLTTALASQAAALRLLLPILQGHSGAELIAQCYGR